MTHTSTRAYAKSLWIVLIALAAHIFIEPKVQATERAMTESEICADLERYSNGAEFTSYCAGV